jgi:heme exporter protein A
MLDIVNLNFDYPEKSVLHDIHFSVPAGSLLHLRGGNGAGKTTLIKLLASLLCPTTGDIQYKKISIYQDIMAYRQKICYVGHKTGLSLALTVEENCRFDLHYEKGKPIDKLLPLFGLQGLEQAICGLLSVGQRRRLGLLRLLMSDAPLWLLDEPLVALDTKAIDIFMEHMDNHLSQGGLVILTSHQQLPMTTRSYQEYCL